jgi:excinuclease ABC subunit B
MGRAARNVRGRIILYADQITASMKEAIKEAERRRRKQEEYNEKHGIVPQTIMKPVEEFLDIENVTAAEASDPKGRRVKGRR